MKTNEQNLHEVYREIYLTETKAVEEQTIKIEKLKKDFEDNFKKEKKYLEFLKRQMEMTLSWIESLEE